MEDKSVSKDKGLSGRENLSFGFLQKEKYRMSM